MKKGFILALLTLAMVAMAMPAGAVAPIMPTMPDIIIGDAGDIAGSGTPALRLLRYVNVADLGGAIGRPNNPTTTTYLSVWYTRASTQPLVASNPTALVQPMTTTETTQLVVGVGGTPLRPPAAKKIGGGVWMSLIFDGAAAHPASAVAATPSSHGLTQAALSASGITSAPVTMRLYAVDADDPLTTAAVGQSNDFKVYSMINTDDKFSPSDVVYTADFEGNADGWTTLTYPSLTAFDIGTFAQTANAIGYSGAATIGSGKTGVYAQWYSPITPPTVDVTGSQGKIFRADATLSGSAATASAEPGYRILYLSLGFNHVGGFQAYDLDPSTAVNNLPTSGTNKVMRMYWETPYDLLDYADGGIMDHTMQASLDYRDYYVIFDLVQYQAGETNQLLLEEFTVTRSPRPLGVTPAMKYGAAAANVNGAGLAFNVAASAGGWQNIAGDFGTGFGEGTATIGADTVILNRGTAAAGGGFKQVALFATATNLPPWNANQLVRYSVKVAASDPTAYPPMRFFLLPYALVGSNWTLEDMVWVDSFDPSGLRNTPGYTASGKTQLAGSPKSGAGSQLRFYAYTHSPVAGGVLVPSMDVAAAPATFPTSTGWGAPNSNMTISSYTVELLGQ